MGPSGPKGVPNGPYTTWAIGWSNWRAREGEGKLREKTLPLIPYIVVRPPNNRPLGEKKQNKSRPVLDSKGNKTNLFGNHVGCGVYRKPGVWTSDRACRVGLLLAFGVRWSPSALFVNYGSHIVSAEVRKKKHWFDP